MKGEKGRTDYSEHQMAVFLNRNTYFWVRMWFDILCVFLQIVVIFLQRKKEKRCFGFFLVFLPMYWVRGSPKVRRWKVPLWKWWEGLKHQYQRGKKRKKVIIQSNYTPLRKSVFCTNCHYNKFVSLPDSSRPLCL